MVLYHGVSDAIFSAEDTRQWVERLGQAKGNPASDFARYFPVPGMNHCSGGMATDQVDLLTPLVRWVEQGDAPQAVVATARGAGNAGHHSAGIGHVQPAHTQRLPAEQLFRGSGGSRRSTDVHARQDFAFWLYIFGALMFWGSLSLRDSNNEWGKLGYCLINVVLVFGGAVMGRRVFTVLGALGVAGYLGYLSHRVFQDSLMFPFALTLLGLGFVWLGVWWQRHEAAIHARLQKYSPV